MTEAVIVALITAAATVAAQLLIHSRAGAERAAATEAQNVLLLHRIDELEIKVEKHNGLVERIYKAEAGMKSVQFQIDELRQLRASREEYS